MQLIDWQAVKDSAGKLSASAGMVEAYACIGEDQLAMSYMRAMIENAGHVSSLLALELEYAGKRLIDELKAKANTTVESES